LRGGKHLLEVVEQKQEGLLTNRILQIDEQ